MRRAMRASDPKRLGKRTIRLPEEDTGDRQQFVFYQDEGGLGATDEGNQPMEDTIYYLGVIDILTPYGISKRVENIWKGLQADRVGYLLFVLLMVLLIYFISIKLVPFLLMSMETAFSRS